MTVVFTNPGELDIRAAITLGVNVKETSEAIGIFGTGFKYGLAVLLKQNQTVRLYSGKDKYKFFALPDAIRGKTFAIIHMSKNDGPAQALGFTTDLGRNWTLEHAYREFWSNCKDERGSVGTQAQAPRMGITQLIIDGNAFDDVHRHKARFILDTERATLLDAVSIQVFPGQSDQIFYRGIAVMKPARPTSHTYNILERIELSEDRTAASPWGVMWIVRSAFLALTPELRSTALISPELYEHNMDWSYTSPDAIADQVTELAKTHYESISPDLLREVFRLRGKSADKWEAEDMGEEKQEMLNVARDYLAEVGYTVIHPIFYLKNFGTLIHGIYTYGKIWLAEAAFSSRDHLVEVLLEEHLHATSGKTDESREFQNAIIAELLVQIERVHELQKQIRGELPVDYKIKLLPVLKEVTVDDEVPF